MESRVENIRDKVGKTSPTVSIQVPLKNFYTRETSVLNERAFIQKTFDYQNSYWRNIVPGKFFEVTPQ